jgi:hypothetical protein
MPGGTGASSEGAMGEFDFLLFKFEPGSEGFDFCKEQYHETKLLLVASF